MNTRRTTAVWAAAVAGCCGSALGQNAIGDGTALDRNLQTGTIGVNRAVRDLSAEIRLRNAVVTGNAPGGMSFRGSVGYRAPGEFMGSLPSDSLFRFRRDAVFSGMAGLGIRGTDALQYQYALTTGNTPPRGFEGPGVVMRGEMTATPRDIASREAGTFRNAPVTAIRPGEPGADPRGQELWTLRSPSAYVATRGLSPSLVTVLPTEGRPVGVMASPLAGLAARPLDSFDRPEEESARPEAPKGSARPVDLGQDLKAAAGQPATEPDTTAPRRTGLTGYEELTERLSKALPDEPGAAPDESKLPLWQRRINEVRRRLEEADQGGAGAERGEPGELVKPGQLPKSGQLPKPGQLVKPGEPGEGEDLLPSGFRPETLKLMRESGLPITRLAPPEGFDAYGAHMRRAEEYLTEGRYFFAEERFRAALSIKPDDPMAAIGRVHAQLGASLFASAALNLRMLLVSHPELIGARYGKDVLPDPARIKKIIEQLDALVAAGKGVGRDTGLLIAYLGFQTGDQAAVQRGLAMMEASGADPAPDTQLRTLGTLLREIWTAPRPAEPGK